MFCLVNSLAVTYGSSSAVPFRSILAVVGIWALVTFPLTVCGASRGRRGAKPFDVPVKTNRAEREIPRPPFYKSAPVQLCLAGILPFSAIYIQVHYVFSAIWGHQVYTLFGILCLAFLLLIVVASFISIACVYFQLTAEDWRWWWRSFLAGAATGFFILVYAVFFYCFRSHMTGALQLSFFFGYMAIIAYAFALMLGSVSFFVSSHFVRYIYGSLKVD